MYRDVTRNKFRGLTFQVGFALNFFAFSYSFRPAVLNLFRVADHLTNFVSVRGPPKMSTFSEFLTTFLVIFPFNFFSVTLGDGCKILGDGCMDRPPSHPKFWGTVPRTTKKNFPNFPNFLAFLRVKDRKTFNFHLQASCDTIHKRYQVLVHTASSETSLKGGGVNFSSIFLYLQSQ